MLAIALGGATDAAATTVRPLSPELTPTALAQQLAGQGVSVSNVRYTGSEGSAGTFDGGEGSLGVSSGIALSSGDISAALPGPNDEPSHTTGISAPGDPDLSSLAGFSTNDAAVLEFDFVPDASRIFIEYVFASDEYNEFVNSSFNDVFAFFVNGQNCATVNGSPVSVNTINNGKPFGTPPISNPELFRNNAVDDGGGSIDTEMDGLSVVLVCEAQVPVGQVSRMKLAIADASDSSLDSTVALETASLSTQEPENCSDGVDNDGDGTADGDDPDCAPEAPRAGRCSDGLDNDRDGRVDFPDDPECASGRDDNETKAGEQGRASEVVPEAGDSVLAKPVNGTVLIKQPEDGGFRELEARDLIQIGTQIDVTNGRIRIQSEAPTGGRGRPRIRSGVFSGGRFTVRQQRKGPRTLTARLNGVSCPSGGPGKKPRGKSKTRIRVKAGAGHSTRGRYGYGTNRGTEWLTEETCIGTRFRLLEGVLRVRDLVEDKTIQLKPGQSYLAKAP